MSNQKAELFIDCRNALGEGPIWHDERQELFWFDIPTGTLFSANLDGQVTGEWNFGEPAAAAGIISKTGLGVVTASGLIELNLETGAKRLVIAIEKDNEVTRSNDSRVGPGGGFWIGTMAMDASADAGSLHHYFRGNLMTLREKVSIPNSICFSPSGDFAYFTDTVNSKILVVAIDPTTAKPRGEWHVFRDTRDDPGGADGSVVDEEGYLWNARYGGSCVIRYSPDGEIDRVVDVPAPQITCPSFGGPNMDTLFITSANQGMSDEEIAAHPQSGSLFSLKLDVRGQKEHRLIL